MIRISLRTANFIRNGFRFIITDRNHYTKFKCFRLCKRGQCEVADRTPVRCMLCIRALRRTGGFFFLMVMEPLHRKEWHERCQQQPCYKYSAFCLFPHFRVQSALKGKNKYHSCNSVSCLLSVSVAFLLIIRGNYFQIVTDCKDPGYLPVV